MSRASSSDTSSTLSAPDAFTTLQIVLGVALLLAVLTARLLPSLLEKRQEWLGESLVEAASRGDVDRAVAALRRGADADYHLRLCTFSA